MLRPLSDTRSALLTLLTTPHLRPPSRQPLLSDLETGLVFPTHLAAAQEWLTLAQPEALAVSGQALVVGYQIPRPRPVGHHHSWDRRRNTNPVFQIWAGWELEGASRSGDDYYLVNLFPSLRVWRGIGKDTHRLTDLYECFSSFPLFLSPVRCRPVAVVDP